MQKRAVITTVLLVVVCGSHPSFAESPPAELTENVAAVPRLAVGVTGVVGLAYGFRCPAHTSDVVICPEVTFLRGLRIAPRWRVSDHWALGGSVGIVWVNTEDNVKIHWWDAQLSARYFLGRPSASQFWAELGVGTTLSTEGIPAHFLDTGKPVSARTELTWGPVGSVSLGKDFELTHYVGIAPEIRLQIYGYSNGVPGAIYEPQTAVLLGLSLIGFGSRR